MTTALRLGQIVALLAVAAAIAWHGRYQVVGDDPGHWLTIDRWTDSVVTCYRDRYDGSQPNQCYGPYKINP